MQIKSFVSPIYQETFEANEWIHKHMKKKKNFQSTGTQDCFNESKFDIYYRIVSTKKRKVTNNDASENDSDLTKQKKFFSQKELANAVNSRGAGIWYGNPIPYNHPRPRHGCVIADECTLSGDDSVCNFGNSDSDFESSAFNRSVASAHLSNTSDDIALYDDADIFCLNYFGKLPREITPEDVTHLCKEECSLIPLSVKNAIFSSLASVRAVRKNKPRLNIAFDTEFVYVDEAKRKRAILSYQFACYLSDCERVLEVTFVTCKPTVENRLSLSECLGQVLEILESVGFDFVSYSIGRTSTVSYNNERKSFLTRESAEDFLNSEDLSSQLLLVTLDRSNLGKYSNLRQITSKALDVNIVCHTGSVDLTAFANDKFTFWKKSGSIIPYLKSVQGGAVSLDSFHLTVNKGSEPWKVYPVNVAFRDTMCYAPEKSCSLSALGKSVGIEKLSLAATKEEENDIKADMLTYMREHFYDFLSYGAEDALITLLYGSRLWGINKEWCVTSTSGATAVGKNVICEYLSIPVDEDGKYNTAEFDRVFRGLKRVSCGMEETASGLKRKSEMRCISSERELLYRYASKAFSGGFNMASVIGVYENLLTWDFDLCNAYPTGLCCIADIDYTNPDSCIERVFFNEDITIGAFHSPCDPLFAVVDYEFPKDCAYPCIAQHCDGTVVFPRIGKDVYASGPSIYLALQLGAKVHVRSGYMAKVKYRNPMQKSFSLREVMKQLVRDRSVTTIIHGKGTLEDNTIKEFSNAFYGKIAQNVVEKNTWDGWNESMESLGLSAVTNPEIACLVTDVVRCMLIGTINELTRSGYRVFSATTDGFITDASEEALNACENFGFRRMFEQCRLFLTDGQNPTIWVVKHAQEFLLNTTTRCNTGFGYSDFKGVNAHGGYKTGLVSDSLEDRKEMFRVITQRTGSVTMNYVRFASLKEMQKSGEDFHTTNESKKLRFNFDMKRKPVKSSFNTVQGIFLDIDYEYANFETEPFESVDEFMAYRTVANSFSCLKVESDWELFWQRTSDKENGTRHNLSNPEWTKLFGIVAGYRAGKWKIPGLDACKSVKEKLAYINERNCSGKVFTENNWKDARKPERQKSAVDTGLDDLFFRFGVIDV